MDVAITELALCNNEQNYCSNMADCAGMNTSRPIPTTNNSYWSQAADGQPLTY